ncbi:MAG TPA: HEPN domain-containing protein [Bacteroidales bacterium]|nr:HEPN domain-containing protein [Bacteroidales bacterium]
MQAKKPIEDLLKELQELYDNPADPVHKDYYSKLALLELCGWLELVIDDIALKYARARIIDPKNVELLEKEIVGKTYGCDYKANFRPMLIKIIGLTNVEQFENKLTTLGVFQILVSQLSSLASLRNPAAHTSIAGVMTTFQAPSTMTNYLNSLHPILTIVESELNAM